MGVNGGAAYLRQCQDARKKQRAHGRIDIQTESATLGEAIVASCKAIAHDSPGKHV